MVNNVRELLQRIQSRIEENHSSMRDEPDYDGETHDKWEEENDAMDELEDAFGEMMDAFESAADVRPSLNRMAIRRD